ncbi:hypothetical protein N7541_002619 [Penicillium brevicompactum]|uniref:Uncharacterized protein n=1 Tax=Penicillium brevicompactum TaxID=5074 RepID=A0A9W9RK79_PENBR|nr:hypothetical protein N7541_002619 [Penicillium brevicompactum]
MFVTQPLKGKRYHVKNSPFGWEFEEDLLDDVRNASNLLARIVIAKIQDEQRLISIFNRLPVVQGNPSWRCRTWMASAVDEIAKDGKCVGTAELDWLKIEAFGRQYVGDKTAGGRYRTVADLEKPKPTWDMLASREIVA